MANFHVIPRGDAVTHDPHGSQCACVVEVKMDFDDVWFYHRRVSLEEALEELPPRAEAA